MTERGWSSPSRREAAVDADETELSFDGSDDSIAVTVADETDGEASSGSAPADAARIELTALRSQLVHVHWGARRQGGRQRGRLGARPLHLRLLLRVNFLLFC